MTDNTIKLTTIGELTGKNFFIPSYQRGYRWTQQQVGDLLDDIQEFIDSKQQGFYCIQPLVVRLMLPKDKSNEKVFQKNDDGGKSNDTALEGKLNPELEWFEVIDGQQRLTTISIILSVLKEVKVDTVTGAYDIAYATRPDSRSFLKEIGDQKNENIDYYHIVEAYEKIKEWIDTKEEKAKTIFKENLLKNVKFIWYKCSDEDPIKVFTRLNIGKIPLTNAELIKAMLLNKSNFEGSSDYHKVRLQQQEIAIEWDKIEYTLQNDEFWLFLNKPEYEKPTRIDFILDDICQNDRLKLKDALEFKGAPGKYAEALGTDEHRTFRYFYCWFKQNASKKLDCWKEIKSLFQIFQEWYNDLELYHYVGFLVEQGHDLQKLVTSWQEEQKSKVCFIEDLRSKIKDKITKSKELTTQYDPVGTLKRPECRAILLLHNIQTVINQNKEMLASNKYKLAVFYKFPFHLFKKENWDVEHIDSSTENDLHDVKDQKEWLKQSLIGVSAELQEQIKDYLNSDIQSQEQFESLHDKLVAIDPENDLSYEGKNMLWNFCLLNSSTNRGYGNKIFPAKRRIVFAKSQGKKIEVSDNWRIKEKAGGIAFVPPCTERVFQKAFNPIPNNLREWDKTDAKTYLKNIAETLKDFLFQSEQDKHEKLNEIDSL